MDSQSDALLKRRRCAHVLQNQHTMEETVESAERSFVLKEYKDALKLSVQALSSATIETTLLENKSDCVCLTTPLGAQNEGMNGPLFVHMTKNVSPLDRMAVIALQASHELSSAEGHETFANHYSRHAMPFEVAILWTQFLFRTNKPASVELASELLHHVRQYPSASPEVTEELVLLLATEMLPFASNVDYVQSVLNRIQSTSSWISSSVTCTHAQDVNKEAVSLLLSRLDVFSSDPSIRNQCRRQLEEMVDVDQADNDCESDTLNSSSLVLSDLSQVDTTWRNLVPSKGWHMTFAKRLLSFCRLHIVQPLVHDQDRWENRRRAAISILLLYLAWKRKRRLMLLTSSAASLVTSPFRKIMDAMLPTSKRH